MKKHSFPVFKTKSSGRSSEFDLSDPKERRRYYDFKAGNEIKKIRSFLKKNTFVAFLLGKKNSGKGTYSKGLEEAVGGDYLAHLSIGDLVRNVHEEMESPGKKEKLFAYLESNYRGFLSVEDSIKALLGRETQSLLPTEFILVLVKREIERLGRKAVFIDGFPRGLDQISYSLYFRDLIGFRDDPDFFILIDVPETVIDERIKYRVVCPKCQTPRNLKLLSTKKVEYDPEKEEFYLICDNPGCKEVRMVGKEGDELGIEPIRRRLEMDGKLIKMAFDLHGIPKILLQNSVSVKESMRVVDDYELTPEFVYRWDEKEKKVKIETRPWVIKDDGGVLSYSLMPQPVVVSLIKQLADLL